MLLQRQPLCIIAKSAHDDRFGSSADEIRCPPYVREAPDSGLIGDIALGHKTKMLKKLCLILSVTAALGLGVVASADAKGHGEGHGGGHHGGGHHGGGHAGAHVNRSTHVHVNRSAHVHVNRSAHVHANRSVHVNRNVRVHDNRPVNKHYVVGKSYDGHIWFGHTGHRWHGRWYAYGVGPCWIYIDGLWFWNPLTCPL